MIEALAETVLETRYLYQQIAAMRHGAPDPPRRISNRVSVNRPVQRPISQPAPAPAQPQPKPEPPVQTTIDASWRPAPPPAPASSTPGWALPAALIAGPLLTLAGLGTGAYLMQDDPPPPSPPAVERAEDPGIPLLEYLDERGYSRPMR